MKLSLCLSLVCVSSLPGADNPLGRLVEEALERNPEILAAQKRLEAARERPSLASSLPDPVFSAGYASSGSPRPLAGIGRAPAANAGLMVSQQFPFPGKRKLRGDVAYKEAEAELRECEQVRLSVVSRLKQAYFRLGTAWELLRLVERNRDLVRKFLRIAEARYAVGKGAQADLFQAQTQLSILEGRRLRLEQEKSSREAEINSLLVRAPGAAVAQPESEDLGAFSLDLEELQAKAKDSSATLGRGQKMLERAELALNLARKDYYPDYTLSAGYFNMGGMPDMYQFRVEFQLPAWFWRKQRAAVAEQAHRVGQARRDYQAAGQNLAFRIKDEFLMAQASHKLARLYADTVIPQAALAVEAGLRGYETGAVDFLTLLTSLMTVLEYESGYREELLSYRLALARLEELTGAHLVGE